MKFLLKNFTIRHYLRHVRRQSKHIQHLHALVFAGGITGLIAGFILYTDYGFWHERYIRESDVPVEQVSTGESFSNFLKEAKEKFGEIGSAGSGLLEGKETYKKDSP